MLKMTYALQNGVLKHISEVENGLKCQCICPSCKSRLVARQGKRKKAHFAHYNSEECNAGYETSIHLLAKEILLNEKRIRVPKVEMPCNGNDNRGLISEPKDIELEKVALEERLGSIIPDVLVESRGKKLIVEIFVTHKVDEEKQLTVQQMGISALEIDLSRIHTEITYDELRDILLNQIDNKKWIFNNAQEKCREDLRKIALRYMVKGDGSAMQVRGCPINQHRWNGKSYAYLIDECFYCKYLFEVHNCEEFEGDDHQSYILCTGKSRVGDYDQYKRYMKELRKSE